MDRNQTAAMFLGKVMLGLTSKASPRERVEGGRAAVELARAAGLNEVSVGNSITILDDMAKRMGLEVAVHG